MEGFDQENIRVEIPGLPDADSKGKKGKKKGNNKKTLSLQNFLQDESQEEALDSADNSESDVMESHFAKLNLDEEELIVMESCHSYIHDLLKKLGPTNAMDPLLQQEINNFPPEAKKVMQKCGGYRNFILRSKDLAVVDKIVAAKTDLKNAQEMAFKEIYNNLSCLEPPPVTKNDNHHKEQLKEIWNSKTNVLTHSKSTSNIWGPTQQHRGGQAQEQRQTGDGGQRAGDSSLFSEQGGGNSMYYQSSNSGSQLQDSEFSKSHGVIGNGGNTARQNLFKGLNMSDSPGNNFDISSQTKTLEEFKERNWKLTEANNDLLKKLQEKEVIHEELKNLQAKNTSLEAGHNNTKNELIFCRSELESCRAELTRMRADKVEGMDQNSSDGDIIFNLQKQLQGEQLKNINLTNELDNARKLGGLGVNLTLKGGDTKPPGFYGGTGQIGSSLGGSGWDHSVSSSTLGLGPSDGDPLGLRSLFPLDGQQGSLTSQSQPFSSTQSTNFLQGGSMFGGLGSVGHPGSNTWGDFKPRQINKSVSSIGLGLHNINLTEAPSPALETLQQSFQPPPSSNPGFPPSSNSGFPPSSNSGFPPSTNAGFPTGTNSGFNHSISSGSEFNLPISSSSGFNNLPISSSSGFNNLPVSSSSGFNNLPVSSSSGFNLPVSSSSGFQHHPSSSSGFPSEPSGGGLFSQPPPAQPPAPVPSSAGVKMARQEQLVKKLVGMLPGSDEETIKNCITALRVRHGKLSGWPTSKIASHIAELLKSGEVGGVKD